jgi:hypothetical protein
MNAEGTGIVDGIRSELRRYAERVCMLEEARSGNEKTKRVPTEFAMNAKRIDQDVIFIKPLWRQKVNLKRCLILEQAMENILRHI